MATLFNTKISATYPALIKTIDNAVLAAALKELTDGSGNQTGIYMNTGGDLKVTNVLEWGSLKDTGENITITKLVDQADGIANNNNDTSLPTSKAVKDYVDTKFSQTDTLQEVLTFGNTTSGTDIAVSAADDITFTDSSRILMGNSADLSIYFDGSNNYIQSTGGTVNHTFTNQWRLIKNGTSEFSIQAIVDAQVDLYYNGTKRFETTNTGASVTGNLVVSGTITGSGGSFLPLAGGTMTGDILMGDNNKVQFGTSGDFKIYHSGSHTIMQDSGTGNLQVMASNYQLLRGDGGEFMMQGIADAEVSLYYDGTKKFETTNAGATVSGDLTVTGSITGSGGSFLPLAGGTMTGDIALNDGVMAKFGTGSDLLIYHDGSNSYIKDQGTGSLKILAQDFDLSVAANNASMIKAVDGGQVELYYGGAKKFETTSTGVSVTGNLTSTSASFTGDVDISDSGKLRLGDAQDLQIYHQGANSFIDEVGTGNLYIRSGNFYLQTDSNENAIVGLSSSEIQLFHNGSEKLATKSTGIQVTGSVSASGNIYVPDNQYIYVGSFDLAMSHNGTDSIIRNYTGDFQINQGAVTKSIVFKVSDANALDTTALTISRNADASFGRDVTIAGDLTVNGTTTTINTQTLAVEDPLIEMAKDNAANSVDIGFYGKYNDGTDRYLGLFADASNSNNFKLFKGTTVQPTTTVDTGGAGYAPASLTLDNLTTANITASGEIKIVDSSATGNPKLSFYQTTNERGYIQYADSGEKLIVDSDSSLVLNTNNLPRLTIDSTGNAQFSEAVLLADNKKLEFGGSGDLKIYHSAGSNSYIEATTGNLQISNNIDNGEIIFYAEAGGSVVEYLSIGGSNELTKVSKDFRFIDSTKARFGTGDDMQIFHDSANSYIETSSTSAGDLYIKSQGTGHDLYLQASDDIFIRPQGGNNGIKVIGQAAVELYYDNSKKFETTSTGVSVTGGADTQAVITGTSTAARLDIKTNSHHRFLQTIESDGRFRIYNQTTTTEQFTIKSTGLVGIGNNNPQNTLHLGDNSNASGGALRIDSFVANQFWKLEPGTNTLGIKDYDGNSLLTLNGSDNSATFAGDVTLTNGIIQATHDSNYVAKFINTATSMSNANYTLMVDSSSHTSNMSAAGAFNVAVNSGNAFTIAGNGNSTFGGTVLIDGVLNYTGLEIKGSGASRPSIQWSNATQGDLGSIFGTESNALVLTSGSGNATTLTLDSSNNATFAGQVGIGVTPTEKLDVVDDGGNTNIRVYDSSANSEVGLKLQNDAKTWTLQNWGSGGDNLRLLNNAGDIVQLWDDNGNVMIGNANDPEKKLHIKTATTDATPQVLVQNSSTGDASIMYNVSGQSYVMGIDYDDSKKFKIASSGGLGTTDRITLLSGGQVGINTINPVDTLEVAGNIRANISNGGGFMITGASASGLVRNNGTGIALRTNTTDRLVVDSGGKVTISQELVAMDIKYSNYSVGSLDTTGVTVGSVTGAGNGSSAIIEFVGSGGIDGLVDVVFHCVNDSGNWTAYKNSRQTAKKVDVDVSGNGTGTLTFTFKSLSGSQSYTPRLMRKGSPTALITF